MVSCLTAGANDPSRLFTTKWEYCKQLKRLLWFFLTAKGRFILQGECSFCDSILVIQNATAEDSGNYSCSASNGPGQQFFLVKVANGTLINGNKLHSAFEIYLLWFVLCPMGLLLRVLKCASTAWFLMVRSSQLLDDWLDYFSMHFIFR